MALPLAAIMAGTGLLNEMTTGRQKQNQDSAYKQAMWRSKAWMPSLNPAGQEVRESDPMLAAVQGGMSGYDMQNQIETNKFQNQALLAKTDRDAAEASAYKLLAKQMGMGG